MIPLIKNTFYNETDTKKKVCDFIAITSKLSFGPHCESFEKKFATWQKRKYCVFVNSGSSANLAIIQTLLNLGKIKKGDSIGFSALTWSTNAMPLIQLGLQAVPIDVELDTLNISSKKLIDVINKYPLKMLFITNLLGFCDDLDEIRNICELKKIVLIEDNCESLGSIYKGKKLGNYGQASTFSFYVGHHMSTIEGGAICTDSESMATMLRIVRAHGWDRNLSEKRQIKLRDKHKVNSTFYSRYTFYDLGYNLRPTEINGFIGNTQIKYINEIIEKRKSNFLKMAVPIYKNINKYYIVRFDHMDLLSNFAVPIICKSTKIRDELVEKCIGKVEIRPIVGGDMTQQPFFLKYVKKRYLKDSNANIIHKQGLYFGNNPDLTETEMKKIIQIFR
jgi:CDP-6-deoxy-D-xylo-4-hexulose-3-dehydrase